MKKFVVIAGNIGVGKSTLVDLLCCKLAWQPFYEPVTANPYLTDFYADMATWAFHSQVFFLTHRLRAHHQIAAFMKTPKSLHRICIFREILPRVIMKLIAIYIRPSCSFCPRPIW